jgi:hypothetical protein
LFEYENIIKQAVEKLSELSKSHVKLESLDYEYAPTELIHPFSKYTLGDKKTEQINVKIDFENENERVFTTKGTVAPY